MFAVVGVVERIHKMQSKKVEYPFYEVYLERTVGRNKMTNVFLAFKKDIALETEKINVGDKLEICFVLYSGTYQGVLQNKLLVNSYTVLKKKKQNNAL